MSQEEHTYVAIDLKSFYASVECMERGLDPMTTNLVVADESRTEKTICLAVSPSLKAYGIPGRARLFEVIQRMKEVNRERKRKAPGRTFIGSSWDDTQLKEQPELEAAYIAAPPRMAAYIEYSAWIYDIYLKYVAPEDIHVYSIDEVFMDVTHYLATYRMTARELTMTIVQDVIRTTGIVPTAGIGTNLYLCKVAMDIVAKHIPPDEHGVRLAELSEETYRRLLWHHRPLTDFWRVGRGYAAKLEENGMYTMGDVARCSIGKPSDYHNEELLYRLFGVNAELLIDHAWGWEPCTMEDIKAYRPESNSLGSGQVLHCPYDFEKARLIVREMTDLLVLDLVEKKAVTDQMVLSVGYDRESLGGSVKHKPGGSFKNRPEFPHQSSFAESAEKSIYQGETTTDHYGRKVPKPDHGSINLGRYTSSTRLIMDAVMDLFDRIVDRRLLVRRVSITANHVIGEDKIAAQKGTAFTHGLLQENEQLNLFTDYTALEKQREQEQEALSRERKMQQAVLEIRKKYGKNAILKGMNLEEGATTIERNRQIGGHKA